MSLLFGIYLLNSFLFAFAGLNSALPYFLQIEPLLPYLLYVRVSSLFYYKLDRESRKLDLDFASFLLNLCVFVPSNFMSSYHLHLIFFKQIRISLNNFIISTSRIIFYSSNGRKTFEVFCSSSENKMKFFENMFMLFHVYCGLDSFYL